MLRIGALRWELHRGPECEACKPVSGLRDQFFSRQWLQQFQGDLQAMRTIRELLAHEPPARTLSRTSDEDAIAQMANLLSRGAWHVDTPAGEAASPGGGGGGKPAVAPGPPPAPRRPPPRRTSPPVEKNRIVKVTPEADRKQYINLAAQAAHPEYGRDIQPKATMEHPAPAATILFGLEPDAANKAGLRADLQNTTYQGGTRTSQFSDGAGEAESGAMTLSAYGGDVFIVAAEMQEPPPCSGAKTVKSKKITIWRRLVYTDLYTMASENYLDAATVVAEIQPAFTPAFIEYTRGTVQRLDASLNANYIGLYQSGKTWPADYSPANLEATANDLAPTAAELADYAGTDAALKAAAKTAIEAKAQCWFNTVSDLYRTSVANWQAAVAAAVTMPANSILAVKYFHPKLSGQADGVTNFWPAGIQINGANAGSGRTALVDPDERWREVQGFNLGTTSVIFKNYGSALRLQIVCRHEIGHATKAAFGREAFGVGDHSASGLMTYGGASNEFSNVDINLLRGWKP